MPAISSPRRPTSKPLVALMSLAGITASAAYADSSGQTLVARISPQCEISAEVQTDGSPACWQVECTGKAPRKLGCDFTALHQIASIEAAPDQQTLAVLSVGEGHPILEIVPLAPLLDSGHFAADCTVNPYPGNVSGANWQSDHWQIESDANLLVEGVEARANSMNEHSYRFDISWPDCKLLPVADH